MTLLRTLTASYLFALVLTGAIAAPLSRPADGTLRHAPLRTADLPVLAPPPVLKAKDAALAMADIDITGSLGTPSRNASGDLAVLSGVISAYEKAQLAAGDQAARGLSDPAARALAEWVALRTAPRNVGFSRITRFLETYPNWPSNAALRRRAEEALYLDGVDRSVVRSFFAGRAPA